MKRIIIGVSIALTVAGGTIIAQSAVPDMSFTATDLLRTPPEGPFVGEVAGVGANSRGQIFVYTRTGHPYATLGDNRTFSRGGSKLFLFDAKGNFVREWGQDVYGFNAAIGLRVDPQDNVWTIDVAANQVVKFNADGSVGLVLGRKPETIAVRPNTPAGAGAPGAPGAQGAPGAGGGGGSQAAAAGAAVRPDQARPARASIVRPTSHGILRATSTSPTASAATTVWRSSTRTADSSVIGDRQARGPASSMASRPSPWTRVAMSTSPMSATGASRSLMATAHSNPSSETSARPSRSA